jgi:hypothetical protein
VSQLCRCATSVVEAYPFGLKSINGPKSGVCVSAHISASTSFISDYQDYSIISAPQGSHPSTGVIVGAIVGCVTLLLLISLLYLRRRQLAKRKLELDETNSFAAKEPHMVDIAQLEGMSGTWWVRLRTLKVGTYSFAVCPHPGAAPAWRSTSSRKRLLNGPAAASGAEPDDNAPRASVDALLVPRPPDHTTPPAPPPKERWTTTKRSRPRTPPGPDPYSALAIIDVSTAPINSVTTEATGGAVTATALQAEVELLRQRVDIITDREAERERAARGPTADVPPAYDVPAVQVFHSGR